MSYDGLNRLTQMVTSNPSLSVNVTKTITYNVPTQGNELRVDFLILLNVA